MPATSKIIANASQIRAARGLLNWSQEDLAGAADLSIATIRKIESGHISPRDKTMRSIVSALEGANVEFLSSGVRLVSNELAVIEGDDCYLQVLDDIYHSFKNKGGEILFINGDSSSAYEAEQIGELRLRQANITWRILAEEGNTNLAYPVDEWRWIPKKYFKRNIQIVYGSKVAMAVEIDAARNLTTKMIVVNSPPLAETIRNLFNLAWENCRQPPFSTAKKIHPKH